MRPTVKLWKIATVSAWNSAPQDEKLFKNWKYPFYRTADVWKVHYSRNLTEVKDYLNEEWIKWLKLYKKWTILFPKSWASTFLNHRVIMWQDWYVVSHLATISVNEDVDENFVYYYLTTVDAKDLCADQWYPSLKSTNIAEIEIPLPMLETQKSIVAKLDNIFTELDQTKSEIQKNLDNTDEFWKSALNQAFQGDWEMKKLGEIWSLTRWKWFLKSDFVENWFPCIHYGQIHMKFDTAIDKNITYISEELAKKSWIAEKNDIIIAITSEDVEWSCKSVAWLWNYPVAVGAHAAIYKHTQNPLFVSYYLQTSMFFNQKINYTHWSKVVEIKPIDVWNCVIPVPPFSEQERIVEHLNQVSKEVKEIKFQYQSQIDNLEELKKSVLYKTFRWELGE